MAAYHVNMKTYQLLRFTIIGLIFLPSFCNGRIHNLRLQNDNRHQMTLSTFGFLKGGTLAVNVTMFSYRTAASPENIDKKPVFGFTLDKSKSAGLSNYMESLSYCIWDNKKEKPMESVFFKFDLKNKSIHIERNGEDLKNLKISGQIREQYLFDNNLDHGVNLEANDKTPAKVKETTLPTKTDGGNVPKKQDSGSKSRQAREAGNPPPKVKATVEAKASVPASAAKDASTVKPVGTDKKDDTPSPGAEKPAGVKPSTGAEKPAGVKPSTGAEKPAEVKPSTGAKKLGPVKQSKEESLVTSVPMKATETSVGSVVYETYFLMHVRTIDEEGLYNLFFHNCLHADSLINLTLRIIEDNNGNFLSADEMPIPALYFVFSVVFFFLFCTWISVLRKAEEGVYKIHYLMLVVVFFKSISCLFHGINMYMIQKNGIHVDAWAILWYIVYLTRGALMFVTVLLIGAGWAFIKHMFTDREKKLFLIVMPLQILENVAWVIVEESEEGTSSYNTWNQIFMAVDLLCCFAILFPVIWSIRHLQEASTTDGKAAINLNKLKLFRFFYILVVCYIYFTRIIVYLLKITLPFHYGWMRNLFAEVFLLCFFTLTGFKFRPTSDNPYLQVPLDSDEEDIEMDEVVTKTGNMESLHRVNQNRGEEQPVTVMKQRESSHEYD